MPFRRNFGISWVPIAMAVLFILILSGVFIIIYWSSRVPTLQVSNVSLNPNTIFTNANATLSFTISNNDASNQHNITARFNVTNVTFYISGSSLPRDFFEMQYYNIQLQSSQQSTYHFEVSGTLTGGASSSTYSIHLSFYDENGTRFDSETESLTVNSLT